MAKTPQISFEPIPSEPKEIGWKNFTDSIEKLIAKCMPTEEILPLLHRLVTYGTPHQKIPQFIAEVVFLKALVLSGVDRPAIEELRSQYGSEVKKRVRSIMQWRACPPVWLATLSIEPSIFSAPRQVIKKVDVQPSMLRRGHLRSFGTKKVDGKEGPLFTAHDSPLSWKWEDLWYSYEGLEEWLDEVFTALCKKFDTLMQTETNPRNKLRAIVFFQAIWSIVHPFFDANGRALMAHCVLELNKMWLPVKEIPTLPEIDESLKDNLFSSMSGHLIHMFLESEKIPLVEMKKWQVSRTVYMKALKAWLLKRINQGIDGNTDFIPHFEGRVELLLCWLSKQKVLPGDTGEYYEQLKPQFIAEYASVKK